MFDFQQKNKLRSFFYSPYVVGIILLIAIYSIYSTFSIYKKMVKSRNNVEQVQKELLILAQKDQELDKDIGDLQTKEGVEKEIRSKFGVAKFDESVVVIVSDNINEYNSGSKSPSFWQKFKDFFGL